MTGATPHATRAGSVRSTLLVACALALATACGGSGGIPPPAAALQSIVVAPATPSVAKGRTVAFTATGRWDDGSTQDLTARATWSSSAAAATISGAVATGAAEGETAITASFGGKTGEATLTVTAAELDGIVVGPAPVTIPEGRSAALVATGTYSDGTTADLTSTAAWGSDNLLAVSVLAGVVTAVGQGEANVTAAQDGRTGSAAVSVTAAALERIAVSPATVSLAKGRSTQLGATGHYTNGAQQELTALVAWSSANEAVASVSGGAVGAVDVGTTLIDASWDGQTGAASVEVTAAELDAIAVAPTSASVPKGRSRTFAATARWSDTTTTDVTASATWTSSSAAVATMAGATATAVGEGEATITADYGGRTGTGALSVTAAVVDALAVSPSTATIAKGRSATFTATARWSDGTTTDETAAATWTTDAPAIASVAGGVVTARTEGTTQVHAAGQGVAGSADVIVAPAEIATLTLSPADATLAAGTTLQYAAVAVYTDGSKRDVTTVATWVAGPAGVVTVGASGLATGVAVGAGSVSASCSGVSAEAPLTVTSAVLTSIAISPPAPTVPLGVAQAFTATGIFSDGTHQDLTAQVGWTSAPQDVATISAGGVATPVGPGTATITATRDGVTSSTSLVVTGATLTAISVDPPSGTVAAGTTAAFTATGLYSDGSTADATALATWSSSNDAVATVSNAPGSRGVATGVAPGSATLTATLAGFSDTAVLTVTSARLVAIAVTPSTVSLPVGRTQALAATGTFSDGSTQDLTAAAGWTSSNPAVAAVSNAAGQEGLATAVSPGTAIVTAACGGFSGTSSVTVTNATLVAIDVTPPTATLPVGYTQQFQATARYSDLSTRDVTTQATWQSSNPLVATLSNATGTQGLATGIAASATAVQITATLSGVTGSASLTVNNASLQSIAVTPNPFTVAVGGRLQLVATGTFSDGSARDVTTACAWTSSSRGVARVSKTGLVTGTGPGGVTITAKKKGKSGSVAGTVT